MTKTEKFHKKKTQKNIWRMRMKQKKKRISLNNTCAGEWNSGCELNVESNQSKSTIPTAID